MTKLVVFDAVGTLLHPSEAVAETYSRIFKNAGIDATPQALAEQFQCSFSRHFGPTSSDIDAEIARKWHGATSVDSLELSPEQRELIESLKNYAAPTSEGHQLASWQHVVNDCIDAFQPHSSTQLRIRVFESLWNYFAKPTSWSIEDRSISWIEALSGRNIPWIIASNFDSRLHQVVAGHTILSTCTRIYDSASVGYQKPDQRFYQRIEAEWSMSPKEILMIGDHPVFDYLAPKIRGWNAFWLGHSDFELVV